MIVVSGAIEVVADQEDEFLALITVLVPPTLAEPGCHAYLFTKDLERPGAFAVFEEWQGADALDSHVASSHYRAFARSLRTLEVTRLSIERYSVLDKTRLA